MQFSCVPCLLFIQATHPPPKLLQSNELRGCKYQLFTDVNGRKFFLVAASAVRGQPNPSPTQQVVAAREEDIIQRHTHVWSEGVPDTTCGQ